MTVEVHLDPAYRWRTAERGGVTWHTVGDDAVVERIAAEVASCGQAEPRALASALGRCNGHFAGIVEAPWGTTAFVDRCRGYPIFYSAVAGGGSISNSARLLREKHDLNEPSPIAVLEFAMAGYVTGPDTVLAGLSQLQAGEFLQWENGRASRPHRYYHFYPEEILDESEDALLDRLDVIVDNAVRRLAEYAGGAPIWLALSGGLDSRLLACKLKQLGYDPVQAFSYGPPGNHEAKVAGEVAEKLGLPWFFHPTRFGDARRFFRGATRASYSRFADGLCAVPNPQDLQALDELAASGRLPADAVLVNGQTGDFITGEHVPAELLDGRATVGALLDGIVSRHFSFWEPLKSAENVAAVEDRILASLGIARDADLDRETLISLYQLWEWRERQCKYVIHGQRIYDFLGRRWRLPLWDLELMEFWRAAPRMHLAGQRLYRHYLERHDFSGLFRDFDRYVWRWPGASIAVVPVARAAGLLLGTRNKQRIYRAAKYFGHYRNHYAGHDFGYVLRHAQSARNSLAFDALTWLRENGLGEDLTREVA